MPLLSCPASVLCHICFNQVMRAVAGHTHCDGTASAPYDTEASSASIALHTSARNASGERAEVSSASIERKRKQSRHRQRLQPRVAAFLARPWLLGIDSTEVRARSRFRPAPVLELQNLFPASPVKITSPAANVSSPSHTRSAIYRFRIRIYTTKLIDYTLRNGFRPASPSSVGSKRTSSRLNITRHFEKKKNSLSLIDGEHHCQSLTIIAIRLLRLPLQSL